MSHKNYLKYALACFALIMFTVASFNYIVDPYGKNFLFHYGFNKTKFVADGRLEKFKKVEADPTFDSFIFGSSRTSIMNPDIIDAISATHSYNYSFTSATIEEYRLYIEHLVRSREVKQIFIGIDLFAFSTDFHSGASLPKALGSASAAQSSPFDYLSLRMLSISLQCLAHNKKTFDADKEYYESRGMQYVDHYFDAQRNPERFKSYIKKNVTDPQPKWNSSVPRLSQERLEQLKELKRLCDSYGVTLHLFMNPLYIKQITMKHSLFPLQQQLLARIVNEISPVYDFNPITALNTDPFNYRDRFHYDYKTADFMLKTMLGSQASAYRISKENLAAHLALVNQRLKAYKEAP